MEEINSDRCMYLVVLIYTSLVFEEISVSNLSQVLVKWTQGRSKGTMSWIKLKDVKGQRNPGETIKVIWRKSKKFHKDVIQECPLSPIFPNQVPTSRIVSKDFSFNPSSPFSMASSIEPATTVTQQSQCSDFYIILTRLRKFKIPFPLQEHIC